MGSKRRSVNRELRAMLNEAVHDLMRALGEEARSVILFGSYARGSATSDSDVDLLLIVRSASKMAWRPLRGDTYPSPRLSGK